MSAPLPESYDAAAEVWALMQEFTDRHSPRHRLRERLGMNLGKGRGKVKVLLLLGNGPISLGEIADAQGIDRPYATTIVDQLETLSLVRRTADPADRRRKLVALTAEGDRVVAIAAEIMTTPPAPLTELTTTDLAQLSGLLNRALRA